MFEGYTAIHMGIMQGDPATVRQPLSQNHDVNARTAANGFTPLYLCVSGTDSPQRGEIVGMLHATGAELELESLDKGLPPLQLASMRDKPHCAAALIRCRANVHATEGSGATALHGATFFGNLPVARVLLEAGANPQLADGHGNTPVALARMKGHSELLRLLEAAPQGQMR
jgi:uncharacterized protein